MRPEDWQAVTAPTTGRQPTRTQSSTPASEIGTLLPPQQPDPLMPPVAPAIQFEQEGEEPVPPFTPLSQTSAPFTQLRPELPSPPFTPVSPQPQAQRFIPVSPAPQFLTTAQAAPDAYPLPPSQGAPAHSFQAPPPPVPPSNTNGAPPPSSRQPKKGGLGWPLAFLILGLAMVGGCCYSFSNFSSSVFAPLELKSRQPSVGVLVMENEIVGSVWVTDIINKFKKDDNIKSIVIRINSPGGAVAPCQEIYNAVKALNKPVIISMGSVAASGGLYIAAAGDHIMANPGTITGSIGVIMQSVEVSGTMEKIGLKSQTIKSGEFKDMGSPFRAMKANERELLQKMVDDVYEQFLADLTAGRPAMKAETLRRLADGRIFTGSDAKELGLVDELGGFEDALLMAAKRGGLPSSQRPELVIEDGRKPWWETMISSKGQNIGISIPPALSPGFSMKYIYQPDLASAATSGN